MRRPVLLIGILPALLLLPRMATALQPMAEKEKVIALREQFPRLSLEATYTRLSLSRARFDLVRALKNHHFGRARLMRAAGTIEDLL